MILLDQIENLINSESIIYQVEIPDEGDAINNVCLIQSITGRAPDLDLDGISHRNPSFRVLVRDENYENAITRLETIISKLTTSYTNKILGIFIESDILELDKDSKKRWSVYANFKTKLIN
jgi:hypothetical protein